MSTPAQNEVLIKEKCVTHSTHPVYHFKGTLERGKTHLYASTGKAHFLPFSIKTKEALPNEYFSAIIFS